MFAGIESKITALRPKHIRIDHVFDFYDVTITSSAYTQFDSVIRSITATGALPYLSLTYDKDVVNYFDWEANVQRIIQHVSGDLHLNNVYYEIGNEPDLFGGWKTYGNKNYFDLYAHAVAAANRVASATLPFKIGGPATTQLYESWSKYFAKFISKNNLRLDFYSWHKYSTTIDNFENNAINAATWITENGLPNNTELVISESGPDSNNSPIYDSNLGAIHELATVASVEDKIDKLFTFEIKDGPVNKWGILTHDGITKPRYNALLFLNNMVGNSVKISGQGSWVKAFSKDDNKVLRTLLVNFDPKNVHTEAVPVNFVSLPSKNFEYKRTDFGIGVTKDIKISTSSANWSTLELMNPNTASILEITPL